MKALIVCLLFVLTIPSTAMVRPNAMDQPLPPGDKPPPTVFDRLETCCDTAKLGSAAYAIVYDSTHNQVSERGVSQIEGYKLYRVLEQKGCIDLAVMTWHYEPQSSFVEIRELNIIRDDSVISVDLSGIIDVPAPQSGIYWSDRLKMLQLPRLEDNDGIEVRYFRKGYSYALLGDAEPPDENYIPPMPGEYFDIVLFQGRHPICRRVYVLQMPANKRINAQVYNGELFSKTTYDAETTTYSWWAEDVPLRKREDSQPAASDVVPKVVIATVESWEAKSRWFFDVNEGQFEVTQPIQEKVDDILARSGVNNGTAEDKAFELVHWVAQNIRYSGQTMGDGEGFTLHSGEMIFEQRSGVCKDIAGMLITMMRAAGLDSYAAMTMAGSRIESVPADQFNHCVTALRLPDGTFQMYDPTWVPYYRDIWSLYEAEQHYLMGTGDGEGLSQITYSPPAESPLKVISSVHIDDAGDLKGHLRMEGDGVGDSQLRRILSRNPRHDIENSVTRMVLSPISNRVTLEAFRHQKLTDFSQPMWIEVEYHVNNYALNVDGGLEFRSPLLTLVSSGGAFFGPLTEDWPEEREEGVFVWATHLYDCNETVYLPRTLAVTNADAPEKTDTTYVSFSATCESLKGQLKIELQSEIRRRQIPVEGYADLRKVVNEARAFSATIFRAEKEGK